MNINLPVIGPLDQQQILVAVLIMIMVGGIFYAFIAPLISGEAKADKRKALIAQKPRRVVGVERATDAGARRKQIADSLKEIDARTRTKKLTFETRMSQAGLTWTRTQFLLISLGTGLFCGLMLFGVTKNVFLALGGIAIGGFGIPQWILIFLRKRRIAKFIGELPNAMDVIVRGVKAGLPLGDCLRIVASEAMEPVRGEFRRIVEAQALGLTVAESAEKLAERVPVAEANFFAIVIAIQAKAGGNLSEALGNLSRVLRERKKMRDKVTAMSMEAKASAAIIGALPFIVGIMVYMSSPKYIELLFITTTGKLVMGGSLLWMGIGIFSMKKMITFDI